MCVCVCVCCFLFFWFFFVLFLFRFCCVCEQRPMLELIFLISQDQPLPISLTENVIHESFGAAFLLQARHPDEEFEENVMGKLCVYCVSRDASYIIGCKILPFLMILVDAVRWSGAVVPDTSHEV